MSSSPTPHGAVDAPDIDDLPTSFGVFKPVGHVMIGMPTRAQANAVTAALRGAGWPEAAVLRFTPSESLAELQAMVDNASALAGFGYEITLLRRYVALSMDNYSWLLAKVADTDRAAAAAEIARRHGATLAVHYRLLTVEELI